MGGVAPWPTPSPLSQVSVMTLGGMSKASAGINLSEDIFAGFNYVQRGMKSTQSDYVQMGKGKDVGFGQIASFNAKIAMGNAEQVCGWVVGKLDSTTSQTWPGVKNFTATDHDQHLCGPLPSPVPSLPSPSAQPPFSRP